MLDYHISGRSIALFAGAMMATPKADNAIFWGIWLILRGYSSTVSAEVNNEHGKHHRCDHDSFGRFCVYWLQTRLDQINYTSESKQRGKARPR